MTALGALDAGCSFFAGYPITPSSEIYREMMRRLPERGGLAVGTPDEITGLNYVVGASLAGARAMTATSGPGWSLMVETAQYALMTETPVVIAVVQRLGPATGGATQGAQGDLLFVEDANSGGYPVPVLAPVDAVDCYALAVEAFAISESLRSPVVLLSDKEVATTLSTVDLAALDRKGLGPRACAPAGVDFVPYGIERIEDVPAFSPVGGPHKVTVTGSAHDAAGRLSKNDPETLRQLRHLAAKVESRAETLERVRLLRRPGAETLLLSYGVSARSCRRAAADLASLDRTPVDLLEVLTLFPPPARALCEACENKRRVVVVEENRSGLYAGRIRPLLGGLELVQVNDVGRMIAPEAIREAVLG